MINLIRSEVLKVRSTQVWLWMLLPAVALTALGTIGNSYTAVHDYNRAGTTGVIDYYGVFTQSQNAGVALLVIGVLGLTTEFRHKTITPTLLATPNRLNLVIGKAISYTVFSIFYAAVCVIVNFAIALIWLKTAGTPISVGHGVPGGVVKAFLSLVLTGVFGLGLGALVRNQAGAMVIGILYFTIIDGLLSILPWERHTIYPFTPAAAVTAFTASGHQQPNFDDMSVMNPLVGGLIFLIWALALVALGYVVSLKRDIS